MHVLKEEKAGRIARVRAPRDSDPSIPTGAVVRYDIGREAGVLRRILILVLLLGAACTPGSASLLATEASAAVTLTGNGPRDIDHFTLTSTTDWVLVTAQTWARKCQIVNEDVDDELYLGNQDESGAADVTDPTTQDWMSIPAGGSVDDLPISGGQAKPNDDERVLPLFSPVADHSVSVACFASSL